VVKKAWQEQGAAVRQRDMRKMRACRRLKGLRQEE